MVETSARLLRLLATLQARRHWSGAELAGRLEVTERTLRRDVERLRSLGYVVDASAGVGGGYHLGASNVVPPLALEGDELVALAFSLASAGTAMHGLERATLRLLAKVEQSLPTKHRRKLQALQSTIVTLDRQPSVPASTLLTLASACRDAVTVVFDYRARDGTVTRREAEPLRLAQTGNQRWYLLAFDRGRGDWRTFRVDRIASPCEGSRFSPRTPPRQPEQMVSEALARDAYPLTVKVRVEQPAETLRRGLASWVGVVTAIDSTSSWLECGAPSMVTLASILLLSGVEFSSLEPASLRAPLLAEVERVRRCIKGGGSPLRKTRARPQEPRSFAGFRDRPPAPRAQ